MQVLRSLVSVALSTARSSKYCMSRHDYRHVMSMYNIIRNEHAFLVRSSTTGKNYRRRWTFSTVIYSSGLTVLILPRWSWWNSPDLHGSFAALYASALRPVYSNATQLNSTSNWVELCRYRQTDRQADRHSQTNSANRNESVSFGDASCLLAPISCGPRQSIEDKPYSDSTQIVC